MPVVIAVAGLSGSGKSSVVKGLKAILGGSVLSSDRYYNDNSALDEEARAELNFDIPSALQFGDLRTDLLTLKSNQKATVPVYSFQTHCRTGTEDFDVTDIIFIDGILALAVPELREVIDINTFVDTPDEVAKERRIRRDILKRGRTREQAEKQYEKTVRPAQEQFVKPSRKHASYIFDNSENIPNLDVDDENAPIPLNLDRFVEYLRVAIAAARVAKANSAALPKYAGTAPTLYPSPPLRAQLSIAIASSDLCPMEDCTLSPK